MKLPHLPPLVFLKEILEKQEQEAVVRCSFEEIPTLAVFIEAVAQSSSVFVDSSKPKRGFLATLKEFRQHQPITKLDYKVHLQIEATIGEYLQLCGKVYEVENNTPVVSGTFTVIIKEV